MAKIAMDTRWLSVPASGIGQYISALISELGKLDSGDEFHLLGTPAMVDAPSIHHHSFRGKPQYATENYWHFLPYPSADTLLRQPVDLWHFTNYSIMPTTKPYVVTVYDMVHHYYPEYVAAKTLARLQKYLPKTLAGAAHIMAISEATKQSYVEVMGIDPGKITVTLLAADEMFFEQASPADLAAAKARYALSDSYLLAVGTLEPRKNLRTLLETFAELKDDVPHQLVVVGGQGWSFEETAELIGALGLTERVIFTGYAPRTELPALYQGADAFVFPSHYEGFGIPPLEAMASGTPVISSNTSSLPEVVGTAALTFDPNDGEQLRQTLGQLLSDAGLQEELSRKGLAQARQFSWQKMARETLTVYHQAMHQAGANHS